MRKWYYWLVFAAIWIPSAAMNFSRERSAGAATNIVQIALFAALGFAQLACERHGEKGKKIFRYISIGAVAFCVVYLCAAVVVALR